MLLRKPKSLVIRGELILSGLVGFFDVSAEETEELLGRWTATFDSWLLLLLTTSCLADVLLTGTVVDEAAA